MPEPGHRGRKEAAARPYNRAVPRLLRVLVLPVVAFLGACVYWGPALIHGYDDGHAELTLEQVVAGQRPSGTRNLTITGGRAYLASYVTADLRKTEDGQSRSTGQVTMYVPLVPRDWDGTGKVSVLIAARYGSMHAELAGLERFDGTIRDALWEGIEKQDEVLGLFAKNGVLLVDEPLLLDVAGHVRRDLRLAWLGIGAVTFVALVVSLVVNRRPRASAA
jgi:hypothetical protein